MTANAKASGPKPGSDGQSVERERLLRLFHDMRTPLNVIVGWADLLVRGEVDSVSPQQLEILRDILEAGRQLVNLVDGFPMDAGTKADGGRTE